MEAAFFCSLAVLVAYYHGQWRLGFFGAALSLFLPYLVNFVWLRFSVRSLIYPVAALVILGVVALEMIHRKISGPQVEDETEEALIRDFIEQMDSKLTRVDRVTCVCITVGVVLLSVLLLL